MQVLGVLDSSSPALRMCLLELRRICGVRGILPTSYTLSPDHLKIDSSPFVAGGFGDLYKGTLDGSPVCVKRMRVYLRDGPEKAVKVCCHHRFPCSSSSTKLADLLPRGCIVETHETPKRPPPTRYHYQPFPAHFYLGVSRRPAEIRQGEP